MIKNYIYCDRIGEQIRKLLDRELPTECAKNISTGDFSILPEPERLTAYLPAVLIHNTNVQVQDINAGLDLVLTENHFEVLYLYPYDFKRMEDVPAIAKENLRMIANVLMNHRTLEGYTVEPSEHEAGGILTTSRVDVIRFDSAETKLFRSIEVPMAVGVIEYVTEFRTYQRGARKENR